MFCHSPSSARTLSSPLLSPLIWTDPHNYTKQTMRYTDCLFPPIFSQKLRRQSWSNLVWEHRHGYVDEGLLLIKSTCSCRSVAGECAMHFFADGGGNIWRWGEATCLNWIVDFFRSIAALLHALLNAPVMFSLGAAPLEHGSGRP